MVGSLIRSSRLLLAGCTLAILLCMGSSQVFVSALNPITPAPPLTGGPLSVAECELFRPGAAPTCPTPSHASLLTDLDPTDAVYQQCTRTRCACTQLWLTADSSVDPSGWYCNSSSGYGESGYLTCNDMTNCYGNFIACLMDEVMRRKVEIPSSLTAAEDALATAIVDAGAAGTYYENTTAFQACQSVMCDAADTRENCQLRTCIPGYSGGCYQYLIPPRPEYVHQLCTEGCRIALLLMALTILTTFSTLVCCCACPPVIVRKEPLVVTTDAAEKKQQ